MTDCAVVAGVLGLLGLALKWHSEDDGNTHRQEFAFANLAASWVVMY